MHPNAIDLTGQRFGKLVVLEEAGRNMDGSVVWLCRCDCGKVTREIGTRMRNGYTRSCGCGHVKHGYSFRGKKCRLYSIWANMKTRCYNKKNKNYKNYGGRGIKICNDWPMDFPAFYDWAITNGYSDSLTIDRINNDGNYEPSNCRWATAKEQRHNQRIPCRERRKYNG